MGRNWKYVLNYLFYKFWRKGRKKEEKLRKIDGLFNEYLKDVGIKYKLKK